MKKYKKAYVLSHNGLGDNITMIGALNYLKLHYDNVYFLHKSNFTPNLKLLLKDIDLVPISNENHQEEKNCRNYLFSKYNSSEEEVDFFICGMHKAYTKFIQTNIQNPSILNYSQDSTIEIKEWPWIKEFYFDMKLDLKIYLEYFDIPSNKESIELYNSVKHLNIIFIHTQSSKNTIPLPNFIDDYKLDPCNIVICANQNVYNENDIKFKLAETFVNIPIQHYIDVIKNASHIYVTNSCFACIVYPLNRNKKLSATTVQIQNRYNNEIPMNIAYRQS